MSESKILTSEEVGEIEARERLATKGPWTKYYRVSPRGAYKNWHIGNKDGACQITLNGHERDYDFMAHAREDIPALCATVRHLLSENENLKRETASQRTPAWTCAICGQFCSDTEELRQHECGMPYRVVKYGKGYEASMWVRSGIGGHFWTPLLATGYWAEPESFSTGVVRGLYLLDTNEEAERAIERARLLNKQERILSIANDTGNNSEPQS